MLQISDLKVSYGSISAVKGLSFSVPRGSIVTLVGSNGAGKSTTLRALSGLVKATGSVRYEGAEILGLPTHEIVARGLVQVPEGRMVFANLSVDENLRMGAYLRSDRKGIAEDLEKSFVLFPRLAERRKQLAGTMSGGEQQMLAIARALMSRPRLLMLDEPSLGIAPILVRQIFAKIVEINRDLGLSMLLVEQNANMALECSHHGHVLETGLITLSGAATELRHDPQVKAAYLGE